MKEAARRLIRAERPGTTTHPHINLAEIARHAPFQAHP